VAPTGNVSKRSADVALMVRGLLVTEKVVPPETQLIGLIQLWVNPLIETTRIFPSAFADEVPVTFAKLVES
jgi:hypothetical protein